MDDLRVILTGDISLNGYWETADLFPFDSEITNFIASHDLVFINLESPCKGDHGENTRKTPRLHTSCNAIQTLEKIHPDVCVVANNHIYDQLEDGFIKTKKAVNSIGSEITGAGTSKHESQKPIRFDIGQFHVSVIAFISKQTNPCIPSNANIHLNWLETDDLFTIIMSESSLGRFVIVSLHWGEDNSKFPTPDQRRLAFDLVDAGANIIWGHHPHVVQGWEKYKNATIFYSLGNNCFDDLPEVNTRWDIHGRKGILVSLILNQQNPLNYSTEIIPIYRESSTSQAHFNYEEREKRNYSKLSSVLNLRNYEIFYDLYKLKRMIKRSYKYFFGVGRNPLKQISLLPKRVLNIFKAN